MLGQNLGPPAKKNRECDEFVETESQLRSCLRHCASGRLESPIDDPNRLHSRITVKTVLWNAADAEREVVRLNKLNADGGVVYFHQVTRVEKRSAQAGR